jgi:hypothetical protein
MAYIGDIRLGETIDTKFCTVTTTGAPTQLAGSPVISAYPGNSTTQLTAGITLSVDFDSVTGLNNIRVVATSGNGYATATNYQLVITTGTVGGTSVVGYVVAEFSIENRSAVMPTTAARTLDVSAGGEAGIDWANIGSPTTAQGLTGTTGLRLSATGVDDIWDELTAGHTTVGTFGQLGQIHRANTAQAGAAGTITLDTGASAVDDFYNSQLIVITSGTGLHQARQITDYVGSTKVATITPNWATNPASDSVFVILPAAAGAVLADIAAAVWDLATAGHTTSGTFGAAMAAAGAAGDPWSTSLPAAYGAGTAGKIIGDNINATISSRATPAQVNTEADTAITDAALATAANLATVAGYLDTEIADIRARLPAALSANGNMKADIKEVNDVTLLGNGSSTPWGPV